MKSYNKSIDTDLYDKSLFDLVRKGATRGRLNITPDTIVYLHSKKQKYCIRKNCQGNKEICYKDINE